MRNIRILSLLLFFLSALFQLSAQNITITQSTDPTTILGNNSIYCIGWIGHSESSHYRSFNLSTFGITSTFNVSSVQIGIESAYSLYGDNQPIICNLYAGPADFPTGYPASFTLIGSKEVNIPNQSLTLYTFNVTGVVPAGESLVVEIFLPNGVISDTVVNEFIIGSNAAGQSAPHYFRAPDCFAPHPIEVATWGGLDMHLVMSVIGDEVVPVELTSFIAQASNGNAVLDWSTASELNNRGFSIERSSGKDFVSVGFVNGNGTTTETKTYSFKDENLSAGKYQYRLKQIDFDGTFDYSNVVNVEIVSPAVFELAQNYPNPFNPSTKITYSIPERGYVSLKVFDLLGSEVAELVNGEVEAGSYDIEFNALPLPSGIYFYKLQSGSFVETKKMLLMK